MTNLEIFKTKAEFNKWLNELTETEKLLIMEMLDEARELGKNINIVNDSYMLLTAMPTDEEIMKAMHTATIVEPENEFQNAFMDKKFVAGFLTAVKWMAERHCK